LAQWMGKSRRKITGGLRRPNRKKRRSEIGREKLFTSVGEQKAFKIRTRGANSKMRLVHAGKANAVDPATGKVQPTVITTVLENSANRNYVQRNFLNKGAIVQTELGAARVTSRPGQDGVVNVVLLEK
jgi:small subunit ribosomal protein S8e